MGLGPTSVWCFRRQHALTEIASWFFTCYADHITYIIVLYKIVMPAWSPLNRQNSKRLLPLTGLNFF